MAEPAITLRATFSDTARGSNGTVTRIVIHATCPTTGYPAASAPGTAASTARYFAGGSAGGSAHYIVDTVDEQHCVPDDVTAYHAPPNQGSIGIEICAEGGAYAQSYTREQWLSPQVWPAVQRAAARTRELCQRFNLPTVKLSAADLVAGKRGVCGHVDVSAAWKQSTHSDVGAGFPWPEFMAEVNAPTNVQEDDMTDDQAKALTEILGNSRSTNAVVNDLNVVVRDPSAGMAVQLAKLSGVVAGLAVAVGQLQGGKGLDQGALNAAAQAGAQQALSDLGNKLTS